MGLKVLVVDGSESARDLVAAAVGAIAPMSVHGTGSGFEALKMLPRHRYDLIIADLDLPDIDALELVNFVKKSPAYRETPLFVVGREATPAQRERGLALGAAEVLGKPLDRDALATLLRRYLPLER